MNKQNDISNKELKIKAERREQKRKRKMKVSGVSVKDLQKIIKNK